MAKSELEGLQKEADQGQLKLYLDIFLEMIVFLQCT